MIGMILARSIYKLLSISRRENSYLAAAFEWRREVFSLFAQARIRRAG
jgi:hypothetical protein